MIDHFSTNTPEAGADVIRAAAEDLRIRNLAMWEDLDFTPDSICGSHGGELITGYIGETAVAAMVFSCFDPDFWPDIPRGTSTFIHKLAVNPSYQGQGLAREMLDHAAYLTREKGMCVTRLDCAADRPKLCRVYEEAGYRKVEERLMGSFPTAFYERKID